jgi:hypothetical protein
MLDQFEAKAQEAEQHDRDKPAEMRQQAQVAMTERLHTLLLENADLFEQLAKMVEPHKRGDGMG